jgi:hypothetical protein
MRNKLIVMTLASVLGSSAFAASPEEMRLQRIEHAIENIQEYIREQNRRIWVPYEQDSLEAATAAAAAEDDAANRAAHGHSNSTTYFIYKGHLYMYSAGSATDRGAINAYNKTHPAEDRHHTYKIIRGFGRTGEILVEHYFDGEIATHRSSDGTVTPLPLGKILPKVR